MSDLRFIPVSGAGELAGNAFMLQFGEHRLLLDCGARPGRAPGWVKALARPDLVWISHAHWDHIGALPELVERFGQVKCLATPATRAISEFALAAGLEPRKNASQRGQALARRLRILPYQSYHELSEYLGDPKVPSARIMAFEAGHLAGAASLLVELDRPHGQPFRLLYTGDFCCHDQPLVKGAALPVTGPDFHLDVLVMEGVLANDRDADAVDYDHELARLVHDFAAPDSAPLRPRLLGLTSLAEACEVAAALLEAGVDFAVHDYLQPIFATYQTHTPTPPPWSSIPFATLAGCRGHLRAGGLVLAAGDQLQRSTVAGQLAVELAHAPRALIGTLNRLHKGTPAARLATSGPHQATHAHYTLPAHAPRWQLLATVRALQPTRLILVHGRLGALHTLRKAILADGYTGEVLVPKNGDVIALA